MPNVPVTSPLSYIGVTLVLAGIFFVLTGIGLIKVEKLSIPSGIRTLIIGFILAGLGLVLLIPDIRSTFPNVFPLVQPTPNNPAYPTATANIPSPQPTNTQIVLPAVTQTYTCASVNGTELLSTQWHLEGEAGDSQAYEEIDPASLQGKDSLLITYDLHGMMAIEGEQKDASAIIFDQPNWHVISLANYGINGMDGTQTVIIPLTDFVGIPDVPASIAGGTILDTNKPVGTLHTRFWYASKFVVDIYSICAFSS